MTNANLAALSSAGVSIWLDDLSRDRLTSGSLAELLRTHHVVGVTTNPSIFQKAVAGAAAEYAAQLQALRADGADVDAAVRAITVADVRDACDLFADVFHQTRGRDGRVSIEVDPRLAHDTNATIADALELHALVARDNVMIKVPATKAGLPAVTELLARGISVNVTLIFSVNRYREVLQAWAGGLERAATAGRDVSTIHSVASFFVSRVDTAVDARLKSLTSEAALALLGRAAIANARLSWGAFQEFTALANWQSLAARGAQVQRPLWASTGVKDPAYDDTRYVVDLVASPCVNTMPEATLNAVADHGVITGDTISAFIDDAANVWATLESLGISYQQITDDLETAGVKAFIDSWNDLLATVDTALTR